MVHLMFSSVSVSPVSAAAYLSDTMLCMSSIQNCPADVMEYENDTDGRKRYSVKAAR